MTMKVLPLNFLRRMRQEDRVSLGMAGLLPEELAARAKIRNEKDLQQQIVNLLRLKGIKPVVSRMDRKTSNNLGCPDILFAVEPPTHIPCATVAYAWECKFGDGQLSEDQLHMMKDMRTPPNNWAYRIIRNLNDAIAALREIGL